MPTELMVQILKIVTPLISSEGVVISRDLGLRSFLQKWLFPKNPFAEVFGLFACLH